MTEKYLHQGNQTAIERKLINRSYVDKNGAIRYITEVADHEFQLLEYKK